ncbi:MAG: Holliday junction resolvase RuvX [Phycisphaeraceae bacterium]
MRYLAIDLGQKRTGLAVGDDVTRVASPAGVIETADADERLRQIERAVSDHGPHALVVGLPINMDGSVGPAGERVQAFAAELERRLNLPVHLVDERLTSAAADEQMARTGLTHKGKKRRRDALAAAVILRDFLDRQA